MTEAAVRGPGRTWLAVLAASGESFPRPFTHSFFQALWRPAPRPLAPQLGYRLAFKAETEPARLPRN